MILRVDENPNCEAVEGRVFAESSDPTVVKAVLRWVGDKEAWCDVTGLDPEGEPCPAVARKVQDSGEGTASLVTGGRWGLRFKPPICSHPWNVTDPHQWGEPFLLLSADSADLRF